MAGTFQFFLICCSSILVPALTVKVKVVTIKICAVKLHCFFVDVNVQEKFILSIENFNFL